MFRMPRRILRCSATALLWLMVALLPLRGLAAGAMPLLVAASPGVACHALADTEPGVAPAAVEPAHAPATSPHAAAHAGGNGCQACDLCHAACASGPVASAQTGPPPTAAPRQAATPAPAAALADGIFRPPRGA